MERFYGSILCVVPCLHHCHSLAEHAQTQRYQTKAPCASQSKLPFPTGFATAWYLGITRGYLSSFAMWADGLRSKIAVQARTSQGPDGPEDHNDVSMARDFLDAANPRHDRGPYHPLPRDQPGMPI